MGPDHPSECRMEVLDLFELETVSSPSIQYQVPFEILKTLYESPVLYMYIYTIDQFGSPFFYTFLVKKGPSNGEQYWQ